MLFKCILCILFTGKQDKGIARGPAIWVLDEEKPLLPARDWALRPKEAQDVLRGGCEGKPSHPYDDLILLGQELGYFIGGTLLEKAKGEFIYLPSHLGE